jgi:RimJ/RimL family protein N-acetyltransferase
MRDAETLLAWRNDPQTRLASRNTDPIAWETHVAWLRNTLANPDCRLFVVESAGHPVGSVRGNWSADGWELSWTVAPEHRGQGLGANMVKLVADTIEDPIWAEVRDRNRASAQIAETAGMRLVSQSREFLHFARPARRSRDERG